MWSSTVYTSDLLQEEIGHTHTHTGTSREHRSHACWDIEKSQQLQWSRSRNKQIHSLILELLFSLQIRQLSLVAVKTACSAIRLPTFKSGIHQLLLGDLEQVISQCFNFIACKTWEVTGTLWVSNEVVLLKCSEQGLEQKCLINVTFCYCSCLHTGRQGWGYFIENGFADCTHFINVSC